MGEPPMQVHFREMEIKLMGDATFKSVFKTHIIHSRGSVLQNSKHLKRLFISGFTPFDNLR